jgi:3-hydroxyisobutyrate dehydrogenase
MSTTIGFIGLGNMGGPMAANLVKAGYRVVGFDPSDGASAEGSRNGVEIVGTADDAAREAQVVITMLPSGTHVLDVYLGRREGKGLLESAPTGALFIDCSTISVEEAREAAGHATAAGHVPVDAPVSGGVVGAAAGTLTFMVGATEDVQADVAKVLEPMAGRVVPCGGNGAGQAAKICNNMILGITMIGVSEAFVLGERLGLTHQALFDVASTASGQCWALTTNCPVPGPVPTSPANRDYAPGFASPLMAKDLSLAMKAADSTLTDARLGQLATNIYRDFAGKEGRGLDFSAVIERVRSEAYEGAEGRA